MNDKTWIGLAVLSCVAFVMPAARGAVASPGPLVNFRSMLSWESIGESPDGLGLTDNGGPPDTTGAVGEHHMVTAANFCIRISDKLGGAVRTFGLNPWWNGLRSAAGVTTPAVQAFDPVVAFDPFAHRWIIGSSCFDGPSVPSRFVLAVSRTSDPTGEWYYYEFSCADAAWRYPAGTWFDQPTLGFNQHFIGISITTYGAEGMPQPAGHDSVIILDRAQACVGKARFWLLTGQPPRPSTADQSFAWHRRTCVCRTYDSSEDKLYLIKHWNAASASYALSSIEPGTTAGTLTVRPNYVFALASGLGHSMSGGGDCWNNVPQTGTTNRINPGDERITSAVYRNGSIWATHVAFMGSYPYDSGRSEAQWLEVLPTGAIRQASRVSVPGAWVFVPAIAVNAGGDAVLGYSCGSYSTYLSAGYAYRTASDPLNSMRTGITYGAGTGSLDYTRDGDKCAPNRTGDYSAATVDPADNLTLWVAQEFAGTAGRWGIQWAAVQPPGVGAPAFSSGPLSLSGVVGVPFTNYLAATPLATNFSILGTLPPGLALADAVSGRISGIPTASGEFPVTVTAQNAAGSTTASLTFYIDSSDLADALDVLRDVSSTNANSWFRQTKITHEGVDAARSGVIPDNGMTWMETSVVAPAEVSFWWKVSSELYDHLSFYLDGVLRTNISGEVPWNQVAFKIPGKGSHTLRWEYRKDADFSVGEDAGWVDELSIRDRLPIIPRDVYRLDVGFLSGDPFVLPPIPDPEPDRSFELVDALPPGLSFDPKTGVFRGSIQTPGTYTLSVREVTPYASQVFPVSFTISGVPLNAALNDPSGGYRSGGDAGWTTSGAQSVAHDGLAAARSGALSAGQDSWLERDVNGPGLLSFWWAISGDLNDQFTVQVDGQTRATLTGEADWSHRMLDIPGGPHQVRWQFHKGAPSSLNQPEEEEEGPDPNPLREAGTGLGWLDEIALLQPAPPLLPQLTQLKLVAGLEVSRPLEASNDPSKFSCQGQLPPGLVFDPVAGTFSGTPQSAGLFQLMITATNSAGAGSGMVLISVDNRGLGAAIGLQDAVLESSLNSPWFVDAANLWNGSPAARSGPIGDSASSWMELAVDGPADCSFNWNVSSQPNGDFLRLLVDGVEVDRISGETGWQRRHLLLPPGPHTLRWQYDKDQVFSAGQDAGWVAGFSSQALSPPEFCGPRVWHCQPGQPFSVTLQAPAAQTVAVTPLPQPFAFNPQTRVLSGIVQSAGTIQFNLQASNLAGTNLRTAILCVDSLPLEQGLDCAGPWQTDPSHPWFIQSDKTQDGLSAAQSGALGDNASSWLRHDFEGPGMLTCWMAVSSERSADFLNLLLDGIVHTRWAGDRPWTRVTLPIPPGTHQVEWRYEKDASGADELDSAWLDQVAFVPAPALPVLALPTAVTGVVAMPIALSPGANGTVEAWAADGLPLGLGIDSATGRLYGTPAVAGQFLATIKASNSRGTASAPISFTVLTPFASWAAARGLAGPPANAGADPDHDGVPNLVEYALGLSPLQPDTADLGLQFNGPGGPVQFHFTRDSSALGCTLLVETSSDLFAWNPVAKGGDGLAVVPLSTDMAVAEQPLAGPLRRVTVTLPPAPEPRLFLRIRVGY